MIALCISILLPVCITSFSCKQNELMQIDTESKVRKTGTLLKNGWVDEHTYHANGIGYPDPEYAEGAAALKKQSALEAAERLAKITLSETLIAQMPTKGGDYTAFRETLKGKAKVVFTEYREDAFAEVVVAVSASQLEAHIVRGELDSIVWDH